ncbi:MAG: PEP-CTERM sorting domain-containing protein [Bryobacteraceae bacterium]|jgi:hypothetical protein
MRFYQRSLAVRTGAYSLLVLMGAVAFSPRVHADSIQISGTVWENTPDAGNAGDPANMGLGLASAKFTSTGILYCSDTLQSGCSSTSAYVVNAFLNFPTFTNQVNGFNPTAAFSNTEVQLTGTIALSGGANSFEIGHDDGLTLALSGGPGSTTCSTQSGSLCVDAPGPTGFAVTPFTVVPTVAGNYNFTLDYSECCGAPAYLLFAFPNGAPVGSVPEPSNIALLGTMVAGVGLYFKRRKQA